jgi:hypothetical protein
MVHERLPETVRLLFFVVSFVRKYREASIAKEISPYTLTLVLPLSYP